MSENQALCLGVAVPDLVHNPGYKLPKAGSWGLLHSRPKSALIFNRLGLGTKEEPRALGHGLIDVTGSAGISFGPCNHEGLKAFLRQFLELGEELGPWPQKGARNSVGNRIAS